MKSSDVYYKQKLSCAQRKWLW